jgi:hypothetical protein
VVVCGILLVVAGFFMPVVHLENQEPSHGHSPKNKGDQGQVDGTASS